MLSVYLFSGILLTLRLSFALVPKWPPIYQMNRSTIVMPCNESGYFSDAVIKELARYGIVDIDWSNAKQVWASTSPMNDQELLLQEAKRIRAVNPDTKVWVYRNLAKALPWFTDVRVKILDAAYNKNWFLSFKPTGPYHMQPCTNTSQVSKCSMFYHDQEQTPHAPGQCTKGPCDCGGGATNRNGLPCGEYLWDHRNDSLRQWLTDVFIMGPEDGTGLANPDVFGFYIDDGWTNHSNGGGSQCNNYNTFGGVTEEDKYCVQDMGLSPGDVNDIYQGWHQSMSLAHSTIIENNGFDWQLFHGASVPSQTSCAGWMRGAGMSYNNNETALMFKYAALNDTQTQFELDLATFLLIRGPYAWLGYGWNGCHSTWEYRWNDMLDKDFGEPKGKMSEVKTGVFQREWSNVVVTLDCNSYKPSFDWTAPK